MVGITTGCLFYIPLEGGGSFSTAISLFGAKGSGNYLVDAVSGTHYTNVPANFFV
jgi:hypothetical protein